MEYPKLSEAAAYRMMVVRQMSKDDAARRARLQQEAADAECIEDLYAVGIKLGYCPIPAEQYKSNQTD